LDIVQEEKRCHWCLLMHGSREDEVMCSIADLRFRAVILLQILGT